MAREAVHIPEGLSLGKLACVENPCTSCPTRPLVPDELTAQIPWDALVRALPEAHLTIHISPLPDQWDLAALAPEGTAE